MRINAAGARFGKSTGLVIAYHAPKCPFCNSRRTKRLADGYPIRQCCDCGRSSLYGELIPEKEPKP
jgi:ribosomal protein L37AE/L43A